MTLKLSEHQLQRLILDYLATQPGKYWRINTGASVAEHNGKKRFFRFGSKGMADIIGIAPSGQFVAIEVKVKPNKPTAEQQQFLETVWYNGGLAVVAYSLEDVQKLFDNIKKQ